MDARIQVYVVPGNHDINNPDAKTFDGDTTTPTATITHSILAHDTCIRSNWALRAVMFGVNNDRHSIIVRKYLIII